MMARGVFSSWETADRKDFAHVFHFLGLVELLLQFRIGLLQSRQGDVELVGQRIDTVAELPDFIIEIPFQRLKNRGELWRRPGSSILAGGWVMRWVKRIVPIIARTS